MFLALLALSFADGPWLAPLYLGLAGLGMGLANCPMGVIWVELYGSTHLGAIRSLAQSAMIFSTAVAPISVGLLLDGDWTIAQVAVLLAVLVVLAPLLASLLAWQGLRR